MNMASISSYRGAMPRAFERLGLPFWVEKTLKRKILVLLRDLSGINGHGVLRKSVTAFRYPVPGVFILMIHFNLLLGL
jgi:hypothetical protein